ncbi:hypothetical protein MUG84_20935 [Paenibacillus sp. KQZ6P-2]|uniref:Uncharacterized protein n=1 Tax=Paenibacillus mangrovi TaxID=2931978 RepID=A0A9X1WT97_9BACL|nr:hypothetical protein [Paenibacillus mangrovi]MCJ8014181.1 hypothetical protein [Paenibacillus mangrovi]
MDNKSNHKVAIYYNLHKRCLSVKDHRTGRIIAHEQSLLLENVLFKVSQKGRERVLREKRKNVHAFIIGDKILAIPTELELKQYRKAKYNPYLYENFVDIDSGQEVLQAQKVFCIGKSIFYLKGD